jgi:hypothetical protein
MKCFCLILSLAFVILPPVFGQEKKPKQKSPADQDAAEIGSQKPMGEVHAYKTVEGRALKLFIIKPAAWMWLFIPARATASLD